MRRRGTLHYESPIANAWGPVYTSKLVLRFASCMECACRLLVGMQSIAAASMEECCCCSRAHRAAHELQCSCHSRGFDGRGASSSPIASHGAAREDGAHVIAVRLEMDVYSAGPFNHRLYVLGPWSEVFSVSM